MTSKWRSLINVKDEDANKFWELRLVATTDKNDVHIVANYYTGAADTLVTSTNHVAVDTWYHFALVYSYNTDGPANEYADHGANGTMYLYVNGAVDTHTHFAADPTFNADNVNVAQLRMGMKHSDTNPFA